MQGTSGSFDRAMVQENINYGQRIMDFEIQIDGTSVYSKGTSVGNKNIVLFDKVYSGVTTVDLIINQFVGGGNVYVKNFAVFAQCPSG